MRLRVLTTPCVFSSHDDFRLEKESRKHYNQLEEARKQQHARKLKLEAQEVALGERDRVTATLGDSLFVGESLLGSRRAEGGGGVTYCVITRAVFSLIYDPQQRGTAFSRVMLIWCSGILISLYVYISGVRGGGGDMRSGCVELLTSHRRARMCINASPRFVRGFSTARKMPLLWY